MMREGKQVAQQQAEIAKFLCTAFACRWVSDKVHTEVKPRLLRTESRASEPVPDARMLEKAVWKIQLHFAHFLNAPRTLTHFLNSHCLDCK